MLPLLLFIYICLSFVMFAESGSVGHRELARDIALIQGLYKLDYIETDLSDNDIETISEIISEDLSHGLGMRDIMKRLIEETSLDRHDAEHIARTEVVRIKNLVNWFIYKKKGFNSFKVNFTKTACSKCVSKYKDKTFDINDISNLPPVYDLCMCVAIFSP